MVRACGASHSGVSIPFVASRRVNFDSPPLKGLCMEPFRFHLETQSRIGNYVQSEILAVPFATFARSVNGR